MLLRVVQVSGLLIYNKNASERRKQENEKKNSILTISETN